jgi:hypothetical protein
MKMDEELKTLAKVWLESGQQKAFSLEKFCFGKQLAFVEDPSP